MQKEKLDFILAIVSSSFLVLILIAAGIMLFQISLKKKKRLILEKEQMNVQFQQTLLNSKLAIQEETFSYIGKEIHDNIGQVLSLVRLSLNTLPANPDEKKIFLMDELMGKAITDLRNLSHSLDTDLIRDSGWIKASDRLLLALQKTGTCKVEFFAEENLPILGNEKSIILFRMIQEIINNIIKHARAKEIKFKAFRKGSQIAINIEDNGKGFDRTTVTAGAGLQNLESRAKVIDANLFIHTLQGTGTSVSIMVNT